MDFLPEKCRVIEPACGNGYVSELLAARGCAVTGFDRDAGAVGQVKVKGRFSVSDFYAFRPGRPADCVVCLETLEHLPDDRKALKLMNSWLKPGGKLVLSVPVCRLTAGYRSAGHLRHYTDGKALEAMLRESGFRVARKRYWGCLWTRLFWKHVKPRAAGKGEGGALVKLARAVLRPLVAVDARMNLFRDNVIMECEKMDGLKLTPYGKFERCAHQVRGYCLVLGHDVGANGFSTAAHCGRCAKWEY